MEDRKIVMKCCICGRVKTDNGWQYEYCDESDGTVCSHGFCAVCYETEIKKIKMQAVFPAVPVYR